MLIKLLAAATALVLCGCEINATHTGVTKHETKVIELGKAERGRVEIKMGAGEMRVEGGSSKLLEADFQYNIASWKPIVESDTSGSRADIKVEQPTGAVAFGNNTYKWDLRLNNDLPLDVITHLGAGEARMNLGDVTLRSLQVHMGVGELRLDLRGNPKRDYDVEIHGGIGQATVYVPKTAGIAATAHGGIGSISVEGLEQRNGRWVNASREHAPATIHLEIHGGIGEIKLVAE